MFEKFHEWWFGYFMKGTRCAYCGKPFTFEQWKNNRDGDSPVPAHSVCPSEPKLG